MKNSLILIVIILSNISIAFSQSPDALKPTLDSLQTLKWDWNTLQLEFDSKRLYIYDGSENMIEETYFEWDIFSGQWDSTEQYQYTYDTQGNPLTFITYKLASQQITKIEYTYDGNQNLILESKSKYYNAQWNNWEKIESTYNSSNNVLNSINYSWNITQWDTISKDEYLYNASNNLTVKTFYFWNSVNSTWDNWWLYEFTYDTTQNLTTELFSQWLTDSSNWAPHSKFEYLYDTNGELLFNTHYAIYNINTPWAPVARYKWIYDSFDNVEAHHTEKWSSTDSAWKVDIKVNNNYNNIYPYSDLILPVSIPRIKTSPSPYLKGFPVDFNHMLNENLVSFWNNITENWQESEKRWYFYSDHLVNSINKVVDNKLQVYPNPFSNNVSFNIPEPSSTINLELYDIQGRKVFSSSINNNELVNLERLSTGIYIYHLTTDGQQFKGKLVKE